MKRKRGYNMSRIFGYARVSSRETNLDRQILAVKEYVDEQNILADKSSGKDLERPAYQALKGALGLREGDTLIMPKDIPHAVYGEEQFKMQLVVSY